MRNLASDVNFYCTNRPSNHRIADLIRNISQDLSNNEMCREFVERHCGTSNDAARFFLNLGDLSKGQQISVEAIENFLYHYFDLYPQCSLNACYNILHGFKTMVQNNALSNKIFASAMNRLLEKLLNNPNLRIANLTSAMIIVELLSQQNKLLGLLDKDILESIMAQFLAQDYLDSRSFSFAFQSLANIVKSKTISASPDDQLVENLFDKFGTLEINESIEISSSLFAMQIFLENGINASGISANYLNQLMQTLLDRPGLREFMIAKAFSCIGLMAKMRILRGNIDADILNGFLHFVHQNLRNIEIKYIYGILHGLNEVAHTRQVHGAFDAKMLFPLFEQAIANKNDFNSKVKYVVDFLNVATQTPLINLEGVNIRGMMEFIDTIPLMNLENDYILRFLDVCTLIAQANPSMAWNAVLIARCIAEIENRQLLDRDLKAKLLQMIEHMNLSHIASIKDILVPRMMPAPIQIVTSWDDVEIVNEVAVRTPTPRRSIYSESALQQKLFNLIAKKDFNGLQRLLGVKSPTPRTGTSPTQNHTFFDNQLGKTLRSPRALDVTMLEKQEMAEAMVRQFFTSVDKRSLKRLITKRKHHFFELLLHACSFHTRYQLAINKVLNPLCMYIDMTELEPMVRSFETLTFYRDHNAAIALLTALQKRELEMIENEADECDIELCHRLRHEFLSRAIEYHAKSKNHHVETVLNDMMEDLGKENTEAPVNDVSAAHFNLFRPARVTAPQENVNPRHVYTLDEMDRILRQRCHGMRGVGIHGAAELHPNQMPDLLREGLVQNLDAQVVLYPLCYENHWVGVAIHHRQYGSDIRFYDSLPTPSRELFIRNQVMPTLREMLVDNVHWQAMENPYIQHEDGSSGDYLIENMYIDMQPDAVRQDWTSESIHQAHLELMQQANSRNKRKEREEDKLPSAKFSKN